MPNSIPSGPVFSFANTGNDFMLHAEWGCSATTNTANFYMDLSAPGALLDTTPLGGPISGVESCDLSGLTYGQAYHYRVEDLASGVVVDQNAPAGTAISSLPVIQTPQNPATQTAQLGNYSVTPSWMEVFEPKMPRPPILDLPFSPFPGRPPVIGLPMLGVILPGKGATLKVRAMNGTAPVVSAIVEFTIQWGAGKWNGQLTANNKIQVLTDANGWATVTLMSGTRNQVLAVTVSSPNDASSQSVNPSHAFYAVVI